MGSLERRLKALEAELAGDECPVCGFDAAPPEYEVVWEDIYMEDSEEKGDEEEPDSRCDGCGRQLEYIVVWDDLVLDRTEREEQERGD
jgi:hypothetical protein